MSLFLKTVKSNTIKVCNLCDVPVIRANGSVYEVVSNKNGQVIFSCDDIESANEAMIIARNQVQEMIADFILGTQHSM